MEENREFGKVYLFLLKEKNKIKWDLTGLILGE